MREAPRRVTGTLVPNLGRDAGCIRVERGDALLHAWGKLRAVLATLDAEALGDSIVMNEAAVARFSSRDSPLRDTDP